LNAVKVHAHNPGPFTGEGNATWLLRGRVPVLIDAGTGDPKHLADLDAALDGARLERVLVTHAHPDHASGVVALAEHMPHVRFAKMPWPARDPLYQVSWEPIADHDSIPAGDDAIVAVHTPGHAPDHLSFWHEGTRTLFCGDLAVLGSTVVIPASASGDLGAYLASLERAIALKPRRLLPAHGPIIEEPEPLLRHYLTHRRERDEQVVAALAAGARTVDDITGRVYAGISAALLPMARDSVAAHLHKLEGEGRVRRAADGWTII
jgi:glyoxylase-like metal-dependent hydrolase (beta-lactamase superfamily II)